MHGPVELEAFRVFGVRCLAEVEWVPVARPTILTGANDGGKTSLLLALAFLLEGKSLEPNDLTFVDEGEDPTCGVVDGRYAEAWVEGRFALPPVKAKDLEVDPQVRLRRRLAAQGAVLEVLTHAPADARLRALASNRLADLKEIANELGVAADGPANQRDSYLRPLQQVADQQDRVEVWLAASKELAENIPRLITFASTAEPNPEADIREALQEAYVQALDDSDIVAPVRKAEKDVRTKLEDAAQQLRAHILGGCPELADLVVEPTVSFKEGFGGVRLSSIRKSGGAVPLSASGAGTQRRITLATWEWTRNLLSEGASEGRSIVVAYDEPDTHLDYGHQRDLVDLIRKQCEVPGVRVVVATHSLNLIDKVSIEDVVHLELDNERTVVKRLFGDDHGAIDRHLLDIAAAMGLRNSVLLHERCFVGVEGVTEQQAIPILFRTATGMTLQAAGIALVPAGGNAGARAFCKYLADRGREVRFIVDMDSSASKVFTPGKLRAEGIADDQMYLVGNPSEIEDLFSDEQWANAANSAWPRADGSAWVSDNFAELRNSGKFSDRLRELLSSKASSPPTSKAVLLPTLAGTLSEVEEVPNALRDIFGDLIRVTSLR
jgi:energy-coupling factor transporter ATP-binding protein EcfA2